MKKLLIILFNLLILCGVGLFLTSCGEEQHIHNYNLRILETKYLESEATCESPAKYFYACSCLEKGTLTFENGNALNHNYSEWTSCGNNTHTRVCLRDSKHVEVEACSGGIATETSKAICSTCGGEYGSYLIPGHKHSYVLKINNERYKASEATCNSPAKYYYACECLEKSELTYDVGNPLEHSYTNYIYNNDAKCEVDGTETAYCDHNCGESYTRTKVGSALEHTYTNYVFNNDAKCEIDGTETAYCDHNCGKSHTRVKEDTALDHAYGDWISNGNDTHSRQCLRDISHIETKYCDGGIATETSKAICSTCGGEYGSYLIPDHNHSYVLKIINEKYKASEATCNSPAKYYYACECLEKSELTYDVGDSLEHSYTNYVYNNDAKCEVDGTETAYCDHNCGESYTRTKVGSALEHTYTNYVYNNDAKCEVDGTETAYCDNNCGKSHTRVKEDTALDHAYGDWISNGNDTHSRQCLRDILHIETKYCDGGIATETSKAICSTCGAAYGDVLLHKHNFDQKVIDEKYKASDGTCRQYAKYFYSCSCGEIGGNTFESDQLFPHRYDEGVCAECKEEKSKGLEYTLISKGTQYVVTGIGSCLDKEIYVPKTHNGIPVTKINDYAFSNSLTVEKIEMSSSVVSIGDYAFAGCLRLNEVVIGAGVNSLGNYLFVSSNKLTSIKVDKNNSNYFIQEGKLFNKSGSSLLAVVYGENETDITIPSFVKTICANAFTNNRQIKRVIFESDTTLEIIERNAFNNCTNLEYINLPSSLKRVGENAFYNCEKLCGVSFANNSSLEYIGENAFYNCSKMDKIELENVPSSIVISSGAFAGCGDLSVFKINNKIKKVGARAFLGCRPREVKASSIILLELDRLYVEKVEITSEYVNNGMFKDCFYLTDVILGDEVRIVGDEAFSGCRSLKKLVVPSTVEKIGNSFEGCPITDLTCTSSMLRVINESVSGTFENVMLLGEISLPDLINANIVNVHVPADSQYMTIDGVIYSKDGKQLIYYPKKGKSSAFNVPSAVTHIGEYAFYGCKLSSVTFGDDSQLENIGYKAFSYCVYLYSVNFGENSKLKVIQRQAFENSAISKINLPSSLVEIGDYAFYCCGLLNDVQIPASVKKIGAAILSGCVSLTNVTLSENLMYISDYMFSGCRALESITIPKSVTDIGDGAFSSCFALTRIEFLGDIKNIGDSAFAGCIYLTEIELPSTIEEISYRLFYACQRLTKIIFNGTVNQWNNLAKGNEWKMLVNEISVQCVDGKIKV